MFLDLDSSSDNLYLLRIFLLLLFCSLLFAHLVNKVFGIQSKWRGNLVDENLAHEWDEVEEDLIKKNVKKDIQQSQQTFLCERKSKSNLSIPVPNNRTDQISFERILTIDVGIEITNYLYPFDLINISQCNQELQQLIMLDGNNTIWKSRFERDFPLHCYEFKLAGKDRRERGEIQDEYDDEDDDETIDYLSCYFLQTLFEPYRIANGMRRKGQQLGQVNQGQGQSQKSIQCIEQAKKLKQDYAILRKMFSFLYGPDFLSKLQVCEIHSNIIESFHVYDRQENVNPIDTKCRSPLQSQEEEEEQEEGSQDVEERGEEGEQNTFMLVRGMEGEREEGDEQDQNGQWLDRERHDGRQYVNRDYSFSQDLLVVQQTSLVFIVIHGRVYNITNFLLEHPGGHYILLDYAGSNLDCTTVFDLSSHSPLAHSMMKRYIIWDSSFFLGKKGNLQRIVKLFREEYAQNIKVSTSLVELVSHFAKILRSQKLMVYVNKRDLQMKVERKGSPMISTTKKNVRGKLTFRNEESITSSRQFVAQRLHGTLYHILERLRVR